MTSSDGGQHPPGDPHAEFRRQAGQHFASHDAPDQDADTGPLHLPPPPGYAPDYPSGAGLAVKPWYVLWAAAGVFLLVAVFADSTLGWLLLAVACGLVGTYLSQRQAPRSPKVQQAPKPLIPLRALTVPELFTGTAKIMARHWPVLLGVPVAILVGLMLFVYLSATAIIAVVVKASTSFNGGTLLSPGSLMTGMLVIWVVYTVVIAAIALPADALLIALTVTATDRAVRGLPVQPAAVLRQARRRMFAVGRLTLVFYLITFTPEFIFYLILSSSPQLALALAGPGGMVLTFLVFFLMFFGLGLLISLAPIAVVVEGHGVSAALQRSVQLLKPAFGRILGIHLLWSIGMAAVLWGYFGLLGEQMMTDLIGSPLLALGDLLLFAAVLGVMIGFFRVLQALIYTDVRIRREGYDRELISDWNQAAANGLTAQPAAAGKSLLAAAIGVAVIAALSIAVTAFSGPSDDDVIAALKSTESASLFKNGRPLFHVADIDRAEPGWYVATIKRDDMKLEPGTVILRQDAITGDKLKVVMGPGTAFPCKSLVPSVAKRVTCFDAN